MDGGLKGVGPEESRKQSLLVLDAAAERLCSFCSEFDGLSWWEEEIKEKKKVGFSLNATDQKVIAGAAIA